MTLHSEASGFMRSILRHIFSSTHRPLLAILVGYIMLASVYSWFVPPFEGPDEAQHFAYIEWLAEGKGLPAMDNTAWDTPMAQQAGQAPLYYILASVPARWIDLGNPPAVYRPNPHFVGPFPRQVVRPFPRRMADNDNRAVHYTADAQPLQGGWLALYLARGLSTAFGLVLIVAVYGLARQVAPDKPVIGFWAAFLTASTPQILYISSVASNDIPSAAFGAVALWLWAIMLRGKRFPGYALATGAAFGLAGLTKVHSLTLVAPLAAGLGWLWLTGRESFKKVTLLGALMALSAFLVAGWWFIRGWLVYGTPFGLDTHNAASWAIGDGRTIAPMARRWEEIFRTYWPAFGWGTIRPDRWVYQVFLLIFLLAIVGLFLRGRRLRVAAKPLTRAHVALPAMLLLHLLVTIVFLEYWQQRVVANWGRLLFPCIPAIVILLVMGWRALHPRAMSVACVFVASWALLSPPFLIRPAYSMHLLGENEIAALPPSTGLRYGVSYQDAFAELISVTPLQREARSFSLLPIEICWRALGPADQDYSLLVHLIGPNDSMVANRYTYPGLGLYPTTDWRAGDAFCDLVNVNVWDPSETLVYRVEISFLDEALEERVSAFNHDGTPLSYTFVDQVRLMATDSPLHLPVSSGTEPVLVYNYGLPTLWEPGSTYDFTLRWAIGRPFEDDYQVFVHLRDPETGNTVAQADGPPMDGWYPTSWWPVDEIVVDRRSFFLPDDVPVGSYDLVVGLYDLTSGMRIGDEHSVGSIQVMADSHDQ